MPDAADCAFLYVETALHAGADEPGDAIDLLIARDAAGDPVVPETALRGSVLAAAKKLRAREEMLWAFGTPTGTETPQQGRLLFHAARPLLFPVRTYKGVFAWITSPARLAAWRTAAEQCGLDLSAPAAPQPGEYEAIVAPQSPLLTAHQTLIIEDFSFPAQENEEVSTLGAWLSQNALPQEASYRFFRERIRTGIALLPDDACDFLMRHRIPVTRRVAIDPKTGTAQEGALWTEESLPSETLLYTLVVAEKGEGVPQMSGDAVSWLKQLRFGRLQLGANRTLAGGLVRLTWLGGG